MLLPLKIAGRLNNDTILGEEAIIKPPSHSTRHISPITNKTFSKGKCSKTSENVIREK